MKSLITLTAIALSTVLTSVTSVNAIEIVSNTETLASFNSSLLAAKTQTSSQFVTVKDNTVGTLKIVTENGQKYLEFGDDFQTVEGPAVEIILHQDRVVAESIEEDSYVTIAPIQSVTGTQRYLIPEGVDLADYGSVAVWCEEFNVTFGYASL